MEATKNGQGSADLHPAKSAPPDTRSPSVRLKEAKQQRQIKILEIQTKQLEQQAKLLESYPGFESDWGGWGPLRDRWTRAADHGIAPSTINSRKHGQDYPLFETEQDLAVLRAPARYLLGTNSYAIGLLNGLTSYVIGTGYKYNVQGEDPELVKLAQAILDEFTDRTDWSEFEQELFWRSREDGEYFLRHFEDDQGLTDVRTVEPEQITQADKTTLQECSFGVFTPPDDPQKVLGYNVRYLMDDGQRWEDEEVGPEELVHCKVNVKRAIKRGVTDFSYTLYDSLDVAGRLKRNIGEGSAIQAATAEIWQHSKATQGQVVGLVSGQTDIRRQQSYPNRTATKRTQFMEPGTIRHISENMEWVPPPSASAASGWPSYVQALEACLRAASVRWNAPEWLATSNAGNNNYASSLTAGSQFVIAVKREQQKYKRAFLRTMWIVLYNAEAAELLPAGACKRLKIQAEAPEVEQRDKLQVAQENQIYNSMRVKSRQTIQAEQGLDPEQEKENLDEDQAAGFDGGMGGLGGGDLEGLGNPPAFESLLESLLECDQGVNKGKPGPCPEPGSGEEQKAVSDKADATAKEIGVSRKQFDTIAKGLRTPEGIDKIAGALDPKDPNTREVKKALSDLKTRIKNQEDARKSLQKFSAELGEKGITIKEFFKAILGLGGGQGFANMFQSIELEECDEGPNKGKPGPCPTPGQNDQGGNAPGSLGSPSAPGFADNARKFVGEKFDAIKAKVEKIPGVKKVSDGVAAIKDRMEQRFGPRTTKAIFSASAVLAYSAPALLAPVGLAPLGAGIAAFPGSSLGIAAGMFALVEVYNQGKALAGFESEEPDEFALSDAEIMAQAKKLLERVLALGQESLPEGSAAA